MEMNRAHERFDESQWSGRRDFMLTFHDGTLECVAKWTITRTAAGASLITGAAEESVASTPAPPAPYRQPNHHRKYGKRDVPRTAVMK
jgi:hypothetical protein